MSESDRDEVLTKSARDNGVREKMTALGYDAENPATVAKFQEVEARLAAKTITPHDAQREMYMHGFEQEQRAARAAAIEKAAPSTDRNNPSTEQQRTARADSIEAAVQKSERQTQSAERTSIREDFRAAAHENADRKPDIER
jgi:hypothetical protein